MSTYSTPAFAVAGANTKFTTAYNPNAPTSTAFGDFMKAVATRYSGTFTTPTGQKLPRVRHYEVWNEPNLKNFFRYGSSSNIGKYKGLVKAAYTNIKAANPNAIVIAGVGGPRSSGGNGNVSAKVWMNKLVSDKSVKFDAYSQHIYPSQGPEVQLAVLRQGLPDLEQPRRDLHRPRQEEEGHEAVRHRGRLHDREDALPQREGLARASRTRT